MARGRMISKTLGTASRKFARLEVDYPTLGAFPQALYMLLVANADDAGRMDGDAYTVKHSMWSTSLRDEDTFALALGALAAVGLIQRYQVAGETFIQIVRFADHQTFKYKAKSKYPENPNDFDVLEKSGGIAPDSPLREEKVREEKRREGADAPRPSAPTSEPTTRSGRPIFTGTKFAVFEWQHTDCVHDLGGVDAAAAFGLDEWYHDLNAKCERERIVVPKRDGGAWLQAELVKEAQRRGLQLRMATATPPGARRWQCVKHTPPCPDEIACTARSTAERRPPADVVPMPGRVSA